MGKTIYLVLSRCCYSLLFNCKKSEEKISLDKNFTDLQDTLIKVSDFTVNGNRHYYLVTSNTVEIKLISKILSSSIYLKGH